MKRDKIKMVGWFVCMMYGPTALAAEIRNPIDTTTKTLLASNNSSKKLLLMKANVIYPEIFETYREETLDYVESYSTKRRTYLIKIKEKSNKYFPEVYRILDKYGVPRNFAALMAIESSFNGNARSSAGAVGYWQFMGATARAYGLRIPGKKKYVKGKLVRQVDDRKNFSKSTHAAAKYLRNHAKMLNNDWLMVAASYNCGIGNVNKAIKRSGLENPGYMEIQSYLPLETRNYVKNFIALNVVLNNYNKFFTDQLLFEDLYAPGNTLIPD